MQNRVVQTLPWYVLLSRVLNGQRDRVGQDKLLLRQFSQCVLYCRFYLSRIFLINFLPPQWFFQYKIYVAAFSMLSVSLRFTSLISFLRNPDTFIRYYVIFWL